MSGGGTSARRQVSLRWESVKWGESAGANFLFMIASICNVEVNPICLP
jgi:hypothetical protein